MEGAAVMQTAEIRVGNEEPGFVMELWGTVPNTMSVSIRSPGGEVIPYIDFRSRETRNFSFIYENWWYLGSYSRLQGYGLFK